MVEIIFQDQLGPDVIVQFQKISIHPHRRDWNFLGDGGSVRPKNLKKCMKLNWNFQRGGVVLEKIPSAGELWIFSGITQCQAVHFNISEGFLQN